MRSRAFRQRRRLTARRRVTMSMASGRVKKLLRVGANRRWRGVLLRHGVAAAAEHLGVLRTMEPDTILDIGANRGQFALVARYACPQARIYAFEPQPGPAKTFREIFASDERVRLFEVAVGPDACRASLHVAARDDSSSLLPITASQTSMFPGTHEIRRLEVSVAPLNSFLSSEAVATNALLKVDVQGYEREVLQGCEAMLSGFRWAYIECSFRELYEGQALADEVVAWLRQRGLAMTGVFNVAYDRKGQPIQADILFVRREAD